MSSNPPLNIAIDGGIAISSVLVPVWVYQTSIVAGMLTALLGLALVFVRLLIAIRDWRENGDEE